jgi:hypothetical protein
MRSLVVLAFAVSACTGEIFSGGEASRGNGPRGDDPFTPASDDPLAKPPPPPSNNPIDVAVWPRFVVAQRTTLKPATDAELCRRVALDFTGAIPTPEDYASKCQGKTAEQIARAYVASPRFADVEERAWVQHLEVDPMKLAALYYVDAGGLVKQLARGELSYDDFAAKMVAHPAIAIHRPVDGGTLFDSASHAIRVFLGRVPAPGEVDDFANLLRPWRRNYVPAYKEGYGYYVRKATIVADNCTDPVLGKARCTSRLFGAVTTLDLPELAESTKCGVDGESGDLTGLCYDLVLGKVPSDLQKELEKPGRLLATRTEFWEEASDRALHRLLGWWKSSANEPETVLPEVRSALATWFFATKEHDLRELYVTIATSILYTSTADVGEVASKELSPWLVGPTKAMLPEQFLDSLSVALDRPLGLCNPYTDEPVGRNWYFPNKLRATQPTDFYGFKEDFYLSSAASIGGCRGGEPSSAQPGLGAVFAHVDLAKRLCAEPSKIMPDAPTPERVVDHLFTRFLGRVATADEKTEILALQTKCVPDSTCALDGFAKEVCGALLRSSAFNFY